jgi:phosphatidate cytidylyltransferase
MVSELQKRIITSILLLSLLTMMFFYTFVLIISLVIIATIAWIEFYFLISKIFNKKNYKHKFLRLLSKALSLAYLSMLVYLILINTSNLPDQNIYFFYSILVSIVSDVGGLIFGKTFKGKKLTKISPNKTISGSLGSFIFSILLVPFFINFFINFEILDFVVITLIISITSQFGDLFISYIKRNANVKDTSNLLPGHGGILDRIDGIIFAIPIGFLLFKYF